MNFKGKKCLVFGAGKSGLAAAKVLNELGITVSLLEQKKEKSKELELLEQSGVKLILGELKEDPLKDIDAIILSPGISIYHKLVKKAKEKKIDVISEIELAWFLAKAPIIAVTGTNGKTTVTTWIGEILMRINKKTIVGGNIGQPLSSEVFVKKNTEKIVAEISSFQLESIDKFRPKIAVILNITPDHLERHLTMAEYIKMKTRITLNQTEEDILVLNYDDVLVREIAEKSKAKVCFFSKGVELDEGIFLDNDGRFIIKYADEKHVLCYKEELQLIGEHNVENALAVVAVAFFSGVALSYIKEGLKAFEGVEHRIEKVIDFKGAIYYNDSKATNPESTIKALEAFEKNVILLAGGRDKNTLLDNLMQTVKKKCKAVLFFGEARERFQKAAETFQVNNIMLLEGMEQAVNMAEKIAQPGDIVLLSPACASFDEFKNYEERGKIFKQLLLNKK